MEEQEEKNLNVDEQLYKVLGDNLYNSGLIIVDDDSHDEFYITDVDLTMGGCLHNVIHLKKIDNPR